MPEGDTVFNAAVRLRTVLEGYRIERVVCRNEEFERDALTSQVITSIESRGKHLLVHLEDTRTIHSHLGMTGAWHVYRPGERWKKSRQSARLILAANNHEGVCFFPRVLELLTATELRRHRWLSRLGPDLLATRFEAAAAVPRFRRQGVLPIGEVVMNQTVVCGVGNVYKSEILFLERLDPLLPTDQLSDEQIRNLLQRARSLMRRNLAGDRRRTRFAADGPRTWVYDRAGEPCLRCGSTVRSQRQGEMARSTFFCPTCQKLPESIAVSVVG